MTSAAACSSGSGASVPASKESSATASASSQSAYRSPRPTGPPVSASTAGSSARSCLSGKVSVRYPPADNPLRSICVHVGTEIDIALTPSPGYRWAPVTSSSPTTGVVLDDHLATDGTRSATARATAPGTAMLDSADTYTPDPHGPPSRAWQLTLTVIP
ncbi:hypothetical protein AB0L75_29910 [Streptomyces sp. NPDC052101]|uniref:hypothetical protein n=1 Tax=Streptomyces sp. NPDC052101 TaxID=3155763 RepID=UPI00343E63CF